MHYQKSNYNSNGADYVRFMIRDSSKFTIFYS